MVGRFFVPLSIEHHGYLRCLLTAAVNVGILIGMIAGILSVALAILKASGLAPAAILLRYLLS